MAGAGGLGSDDRREEGPSVAWGRGIEGRKAGVVKEGRGADNCGVVVVGREGSGKEGGGLAGVGDKQEKEEGKEGGA